VSHRGHPALPKPTVLDLPQEEQAAMLAALRRALWLRAGPPPLVMVGGWTPPDGHRRRPGLLALPRLPHRARLPGEGSLEWRADDKGPLLPPRRGPVLCPRLRRSRLALRKVSPRAYGWCRTRGSCATLALTLQDTRSLTVSAETVRRWVHEVGWVWKRSKLVAQDDDP